MQPSGKPHKNTPIHPARHSSGHAKRATHRLLLPLALFSSLLLTACDKPTWPYPIKDSGFSSKDAGYHSAISWLDERRVLFEGHEGGKPRSVEAQQAIQWGLFIWDVEANRVEKYKVPAEGLCYHNSFIKYFTRDPNGERVLLKGEMGNEQPYPGSFYHDTARSRFSINGPGCYCWKSMGIWIVGRKGGLGQKRSFLFRRTDLNHLSFSEKRGRNYFLI